MWAAWIGIFFQFAINMEIERYAMLTGESVITGFARIAKFWPVFFLLCNIIPWMWPGWSTGAGTCLSFLIGGDHVVYSIVGLLISGLIFSLGPVIYRSAFLFQSTLICFAFVLMVLICVSIFSFESLPPLASGLVSIGSIPDGVDFSILATAIAFAGAGGTLNIAQGFYVRESGYAMGGKINRLTSPITGNDEPIATTGFTFSDTPENMTRWKRWWQAANIEHFVTFFALGLASIIILALISYNSIGGTNATGFDFINEISFSLQTQLGNWARIMFLLMGTAILFTTCLGIMDATARISADILKTNLRFVNRSQYWSTSKLYLTFVWITIALGIAILLSGMDQPLLLLKISGSINILVMFVYTSLLIYMNSGKLLNRKVAMSGIRFAILLTATAFYGYFCLRAIFALLKGDLL